MLPPHVRRMLRKLWNACAADGLGPTAAVEQISYLLLLKILEAGDTRCQVEEVGASEVPRSSPFEDGDDLCRWSRLVAFSHRDCEGCYALVRDTVFPWLRRDRIAEALPGCKEYLQRARLAFSKPTLLQSALACIDALFAPVDDPGLHAAIYDTLLSMEEEAIASSSKPTGRIFTPDRLARLMSLLVRLRADDWMWDPCCGNGHLLTHMYRSLRQVAGESLNPDQIYGCDLDPSVAFEAWMRLFLLGVRAPRVVHTDTLGSVFHSTALAPCAGQGFATAVFSNPPFGGVTDKADIGPSLKGLGTTRTELLFLEIILQALKPGGRAAVIVSDNLLFGSSKAHRTLRQKLLGQNRLLAVISLPEEVFAPWASTIRTDLLVFEKGGSTEEIWFYEVPEDGLRPVTNGRQPDLEHDALLDVLVRFYARSSRGGEPSPAGIDPLLWQGWLALSPEERERSCVQPRASAVLDGPLCGEIVVTDEPRAFSVPVERVEAKRVALDIKLYKQFKQPEDTCEDPRALLEQMLADIATAQDNLREMLAWWGGPTAATASPIEAEVGMGLGGQRSEGRQNAYVQSRTGETVTPQALTRGNGSVERGADPLTSCLRAQATGNILESVVVAYFTPWELEVAGSLLVHEEGGYLAARAFLLSQARLRKRECRTAPPGVWYTTRGGVVTINDARTPELNPPVLTISLVQLVRLLVPATGPVSAPAQLALWST